MIFTIQILNWRDVITSFTYKCGIPIALRVVGLVFVLKPSRKNVCTEDAIHNGSPQCQVKVELCNFLSESIFCMFLVALPAALQGSWDTT